MPRRDVIALPSPAPGTARQLVVYRFGATGARPSTWIHAALHADELPGVLVLHHLLARLEQAEHDGAIPGEIAVAPFANPVGLAQHVGGNLLGRYALDGGGNFNRGFTEVRDALEAAVREKLVDDAAGNVALIRAESRRLLDEPVLEESEVLKRVLQRQAADADIALDLHCDDQAALHLYTVPQQASAFLDLAGRLGAVALLTAPDSGDVPFDEALTRPWLHLAARFPDRPVPVDACLSATIELRGRTDIDDGTAARDAMAIFEWLQVRGAIAGAPPAAPPPCAATPLEGVDVVKAPAAGLWLPAVMPGTRVAAGDTVGMVLDPAALPAQARTTLHTRVAGMLFARITPGLVRAGDRVAKIAGVEPLPDRKGKLLGD
jgi:predicted deacylase